MTGEALPPCESCAHNLHRVGDGRHPRPEPVDLCRNALGVFHMVDCPLTVGLACTYYEPAETPHPVTSDADLEAARDELHPEFLGWRYRRRVRWLTKPKNIVPVGIVLEGPPEADEIVPDLLAMRERPPEAIAVETPPGTSPPADGSAPAAAPSAPERYPGQRRSEERLAKKRARLAAIDAAATAKAAQIAAVNQNPPSDDDDTEDLDDDESDDDDFGADLADEPPVDTGPKTVEQVLAALPDAPMVGQEPRRQGPPRGDDQPRHRRRRGRRGRGPGAGPAPSQGQGQGQGQGRGPGPRPGGPRGPHGQRGPRGPRGPRGGGGGGPPGGGAPSSSAN